MAWLQWFLGLRPGDANSSYYLFWSGIGSDLGELAIAGWLWAFLRKHNCEVHRCWRIGRHATAAGHIVCRHHNPAGTITAAAVNDEHASVLRVLRMTHHVYLGTRPEEHRAD